MEKLTFSHSQVTFVFTGRKLDPPAPGTYDATKWTPAKHHVWTVSIQNDGLWWIKLGGAEIASGDCAPKPSRKAAMNLILTKCSKFFN